VDNTLLLTFVLAALVVLVIPGPGVLYVITRSLIQGLPAGLISVLGLAVGALVHVIAATVGLSAVLLASATTFGIIKFLGALYLIYLGLRAILVRQPASDISIPKTDSLRRIFIDGVVVSVFNPKIAVFFLAFLPQFISSEQSPIAHQFLFLGLLYVILAVCTDGAYALFASSLRNFLNRRLMLGPVPRIASGFVYLAMGASLAFSDRRT